MEDKEIEEYKRRYLARFQYPPSKRAKPITPENIDQIEKETIEKVAQAITALEGALATWEASKEKTEELEGKFKNYKQFRDALADWETRMLKSKGTLSFWDRLQMIWEYIRICNIYRHSQESAGEAIV